MFRRSFRKWYVFDKLCQFNWQKRSSKWAANQKLAADMDSSRQINRKPYAECRKRTKHREEWSIRKYGILWCSCFARTVVTLRYSFFAIVWVILMRRVSISIKMARRIRFYCSSPVYCSLTALFCNTNCCLWRKLNQSSKAPAEHLNLPPVDEFSVNELQILRRMQCVLGFSKSFSICVVTFANSTTLGCNKATFGRKSPFLHIISAKHRKSVWQT